MVADVTKLWEERKDGLKKSIEIVEEAERHEKFKTDQKENIKKALEAAIELALRAGIPHTTKAEATENEEEEIKLTKAEVEKLIALFKKQLDGITAVEKLLTIEIRLDKEIDKCLDDLKKATAKEDAKKLLDKIKDFAKTEKRLIDVDEYKQLRLLINEFDQIKQSYAKLHMLSDAFVEAAKTKHASDPLFRVGMEIQMTLQKMDKHIKDDESAKLRIIVKALEELMGDDGVEAKLMKYIDVMKNTVEEYPGADFNAFINNLVNPFEDLLKNVKDHMAAFVTTIKSLEADIKDIIAKLAEIITFLEEAKKLVK
jgi:hypothetical protein